MRLYELRLKRNDTPTWVFAHDSETAAALFAARQFLLDNPHHRYFLEEIEAVKHRSRVPDELFDLLDYVAEGIASEVPGVGWCSRRFDYDIEW